MARHGTVDSFTAKAVANLSTNQYHGLRATGADQVNVSSEAAGGANDLVGVLQNKPTSGQAATVGYFGESKIVAGGAITAHTFITTNGSGRAAAATSGQLVLGRALTTASADGEVITALLAPVYRLSGAV